MLKDGIHFFRLERALPVCAELPSGSERPLFEEQKAQALRRGVEAVAVARDVQRPETLCREAVELTLVSSRVKAVPCLPGTERRISRDSGVTVAIYPSERTINRKYQ